MARFRATSRGLVPLTAAQEAARDAEELAWANRTVPTKADRAETRLTGTPEIDALVDALATRLGITKRQLLDDIRLAANARAAIR